MAYYSAAAPVAPSGGGISEALGIYDQFLGLGHDARKQALAGAKQSFDQAAAEEDRRQAQFPGQQTLQTQNIDANKLALDRATRATQTEQGLRASSQLPNFTLPAVFPGLAQMGDAINAATNTAFLSDHSKAFHDLAPEQQQGYLHDFQKASGGNGTPADLSESWDKNAAGLAGTLSIVPPKVVGSPNPLYPSQITQTSGQPPTAAFSPIDPTFTRQLELQGKREEAVKGLRDVMGKNAAITYYLGSGEHPGVRQIQSSLDSLVQAYRDPKTGQVDWSKVNPSEAFSILFAEGNVNAPGAVIRQSEMDNIASQIGLKDKAENIYRNVMAGQHYPPKLLENIYNTVVKKADGAKQQFFQNMSGVEEEGAKNPYVQVGVDRLLQDPRLVQEYQDWKTSAPTANSGAPSLSGPPAQGSPGSSQSNPFVPRNAQEDAQARAIPGMWIGNGKGKTAQMPGGNIAPQASPAVSTTPDGTAPQGQPQAQPKSPAILPDLPASSGFPEPVAKPAFSGGHSTPDDDKQARLIDDVTKAMKKFDGDNRMQFTPGFPNSMTYFPNGLNPSLRGYFDPQQARAWAADMKLRGVNDPRIDEVLKLFNLHIKPKTLPNIKPSSVSAPASTARK